VVNGSDPGHWGIAPCSAARWSSKSPVVAFKT
jgi:hypothetical protein